MFIERKAIFLGRNKSRMVAFFAEAANALLASTFAEYRSAAFNKCSGTSFPLTRAASLMIFLASSILPAPINHRTDSGTTKYRPSKAGIERIES